MKRWAALLVGLVACGEPLPQQASGGGGAGGAAELLCKPETVEPCYTGRQGSAGIGACRFGFHYCLEDGSGFDVCEDEVTPVLEDCDTPEDDDCDGEVNEEGVGCECEPGSMQSCYYGPTGTERVGTCAAGSRECLPTGFGYGACEGQVLPAADACDDGVDQNCDGTADEACE